VRKLLGLIGRDESRHIAAGQRFFVEVYPHLKKHRHEIMAKHLATTIMLLVAAYDLVQPMNKLDVDLAQVLDGMYQHYEDVLGALPPFPEQGLRDALMKRLRKQTPLTIAHVKAVTSADGHVDMKRLVSLCSRALRSPRALRDLIAA
ncbi:MAG TPA: hypothetical protein VIF15_12820, partial [Polyangiaceae bacterium]